MLTIKRAMSENSPFRLVPAVLVLLALSLFSLGGGSVAFAEGTNAAVITETGTGYATVQEAIAAAEPGQTVVAQGDVSEQLTITKAITLDLGGHTYTSSTAPGISISDGVVPTITNGTISGINSTSATKTAIYANGAGVNLSNLTFTGNSGTFLVRVNYAAATTPMSFSGVTFEGNTNGALVYVTYGTGYTVENCTFKNNISTNTIGSTNAYYDYTSSGGTTYRNTYKFFYSSGTGDVTFTGCTFSGNQNYSYVVLSNSDLTTFNNCSLTGNSGVGYVMNGHKLALSGCHVTDNNVLRTTVSSDINEDGAVTLTNTLVKGNSSSGDARTYAAGVYAYIGDTVTTTTDAYGVETTTRSGGIIFTNSAVYGNTNSTENGAADFSFHSRAKAAEGYDQVKYVDVTGMKDPDDPSVDFSNYVLNDSGTVLLKTVAYEARIGNDYYTTFEDAYDAAADGDTIVLVATDEAGVPANVWIDYSNNGTDDPCYLITKSITIDLNGHGMYGEQLRLGEDVKVTLTNSGGANVVDSQVALLGGSKLTAQGGVDFNNWIYPNTGTGTLRLEGTHKDVNILQWVEYTQDDETGVYTMTFPASIEIGDDFALEDGCDLCFFIYTDLLNSTTAKVADVALVTGATEDLADHIYLYDITNPLISVVYKDSGNSTIALHKGSGTFIYLDGQGGDDTNNGDSAGTAVKTFGKAEALAETALAAAPNDPVYVYVCGTVDVAGEQSFSSQDGITYLREPSFGGYLFSVSGSEASLTLKDVTIDGNSANLYASKSLVHVTDGATLNIKDGATLRNNWLGDQDYMQALGGAVLAEGGSTVNMDGGSVGGNLACRGGGIYVTGEGTTLNVSGGTITGNQAVVETTKTSVVDANGDTSRSVYVAGGGGVAAWMGASVNITGGSISENTSSSNGGGVMVGFSTTLEDIGVTTLTMAGGTVSDNTAADNGGGIFVASGTTTGYSTATISGGAITGNQAAVYEGNDFHTFAGGGIYVNGIQHQSGDTYHDGVLYLRNALITNNAVNSEGGGIAACPTSSLTFYASDGAAIVDNYSSAGDQTDIYVGGANNPYLYGEPSYVVSATMLGGAPYNWKSGDTNKTVGLASLEGTLTISGLVNSSHLSLYTDERANQATQSLATTIISGNTSGTSGGGIGANGTVIIGTEDDTQLRVVKQWSDANDAAGIHPDSVDVRLYRQTRATNGTLGEATLIGYATLTPGDDGSWSDTITFTHLPKADGDGNAYVYSVSDDVTGYRADTASSVDEDGVVLVTLTNTASVQVQVTKAWDDGDDADGIRPGSVTVHLLANGEDTGKTLVLTGEDGWSGAFADLDRYDSEGNEISYRVSEDVPEGYASTVTGDAASGFTITNSHTPGQHTTTTTKTTTSRTRIVETGDTTSVVPVVGVVVAGAALVAGGACLRRRTRR